MTKKGFHSKCYFCNSPKTSTEHYPPRSFYPNGGAGLQLKTVPSCELHNSGKSSDDQYVLAHISLNTAKGNNLASKRFKESVLPQIKEKDKFAKLISGNSFDMENGARAYEVNIDKFNLFFDHLVAAIFYKRYEISIDLELHNVRHNYLNFDNLNSLDFSLIDLFNKSLGNLLRREEHVITEEFVYKYDIVDYKTRLGNITIQHIFYETFKVESYLTFNLNYYLKNKEKLTS
ncbi:MAG: hypothetical protein WA160_16020 [Pseudobdellovibrio sp.]